MSKSKSRLISIGIDGFLTHPDFDSSSNDSTDNGFNERIESLIGSSHMLWLQKKPKQRTFILDSVKEWLYYSITTSHKLRRNTLTRIWGSTKITVQGLHRYPPSWNWDPALVTNIYLFFSLNDTFCCIKWLFTYPHLPFISNFPMFNIMGRSGSKPKDFL